MTPSERRAAASDPYRAYIARGRVERSLAVRAAARALFRAVARLAPTRPGPAPRAAAAQPRPC